MTAAGMRCNTAVLAVDTPGCVFGVVSQRFSHGPGTFLAQFVSEAARDESAELHRTVPTTASDAESGTKGVLQLTMNAFELVVLYNATVRKPGRGGNGVRRRLAAVESTAVRSLLGYALTIFEYSP